MFVLFSLLYSSACILLCFLFCVFVSFVFNCLISFWCNFVWLFSCVLYSFIFLWFLVCVCVLFVFVCLVLFLPFVWGFVCLFYCCCCCLFLSLLFVLGFVSLFVFFPHIFFSIFSLLYCHDVWLEGSWFPCRGSGLILCGGSTESRTLDWQGIPGPGNINQQELSRNSPSRIQDLYPPIHLQASVLDALHQITGKRGTQIHPSWTYLKRQKPVHRKL